MISMQGKEKCHRLIAAFVMPLCFQVVQTLALPLWISAGFGDPRKASLSCPQGSEPTLCEAGWL